MVRSNPLGDAWVCDFCGTTGRTRPGELTDHVQCPTCGEPVVPLGH